MFVLVLRLPLPLNPAGALEPAFALGRGLKAACALGAEFAVFELDAVLAPPVELDALLGCRSNWTPHSAAVESEAGLLPVPLDAVLALPVELDAALALLPVAARPEEPTLCVFRLSATALGWQIGAVGLAAVPAVSVRRSWRQAWPRTAGRRFVALEPAPAATARTRSRAWH